MPDKKAAALSSGGLKFLYTTKLQQSGEVLDGTDHLRNVGVLVVVPGNDLDLGLAVGQLVDHGLGSVEQGAEGHADDVGRNDLILGVAVGLGLSSLHGSVDLSNSNVLSNNSVQDGGGAGGGGDTLSSADQLAVQLGDDQADSLGSAGGVGDNVDSASAVWWPLSL